MTSSSSISLRPFLKSSSMVSICVPAFLRWELHQAVNVWETSMIHINIQLVIQPHIHTMSMSYLLLAQHLNPTLNFHQMRTLAQNIVTKLNVWDSSRFKSLQDCSDTMKPLTPLSGQTLTAWVTSEDCANKCIFSCVYAKRGSSRFHTNTVWKTWGEKIWPYIAEILQWSKHLYFI